MSTQAAKQSAAVFEETRTFDAWDSDYYHSWALKYYDRAVDRMLRMLRPPPGTQILDAGCGPGVHSARVASAGYNVMAVDISSVAIAEAQRRVRAAGCTERVQFRQADLTRLDFEPELFDCIFSWGVIIHIPEAKKAISEMARVLKPGGRLALYVTNATAIDHKVETAARWICKKPLKLENGDLGVGCRYKYQGEELWVWRMKAEEVALCAKTHGLELVSREAGELSELQRHLPGMVRAPLHLVNRYWHALRLPAWPCVAQLLVFERKQKAG